MLTTLSVARGVALLAVLALVAAACGPAPDEDDPDDVADEDAAFTWAVTGADGPTHEAVADLWNEENPDQQVDLELLSPEADDQRQAMFNDQVTGAGEYDVLGLDVIWTGEFAEAGFIENLDDMRDAVDGYSIPGTVESAEWQGELWAVPYVTGFGFLYYRTDLVDEPPETWEDLYDTVLEVQEDNPDIDGYVGQGDTYEGFVVNYLEYLWSAGGEVFDEEQSASLLLEGDHAERAITFMQDAFEEGVFASDFNTMVEDDARLAFQAGDAIFMRNWPYAYPLALEDDDDDPSDVVGDFDIAPLPTFEGTDADTISTLGGLNNAVSTLSENQDVAREFVEWAATDREVQEILAEMQPPPTAQWVYDEYEDFLDEDLHPIYEVLEQVQEEGRARPPVPGYNSFSLAVQENLHAVYAEGADPGPALETVNEAAEDALVEEIDPDEEAEELDDAVDEEADE